MSRRSHLATAILIIFLSGCSAIPFGQRSVSERFELFLARYLDGTLFENPKQSAPFSWLRMSTDSISAVHATEGLSELRSFDTTRLSVDQRIDWLQVEAAFKLDVRDTILHSLERTPISYLTIGGLYRTVNGKHDPSDSEWKNILSTLSDAPIALALGCSQLRHPPKLWTQLAVNTSLRYEGFLTTTLREKIQHSPDSMRVPLEKARLISLGALQHYRTFLTDTLDSAPGNSWAVGPEYYDWLLREVNFLPYTSAQMIETGWKIHNETKNLLVELARRIDPTKSWLQLVDEMKTHHPEPYKIMDAYHEESDRVRKLLVDKNLIAIPPAESLIFVPTPPSLRETYAWGGYGGAEIENGKTVGRFFVTDIVPEMTQQQIDEKLRTQNTGWLTVISLHEGYPGHHLQTIYADHNPRKVRSRLGNTYYGEGWALYCESWMAREGFYLDKWDSLGWLQMRLWRTARVIIDPSIHTGKMSYEQAVQFFLDEVGLERSAAEAEVNRYTTWPTQAPSYIIGWLEIEKLKSEIQQQLRGQFEEKTFVETLLSVGSLPLELMKRAVRNKYSERDHLHNTYH